MGLGRSQSRVKALAEKYIYLVSPEASKEIDELKKALATERAKPVEVREVIKEVPSPHNNELLMKYNSALKEIGALKSMKPRTQVELKETFREVPRLIFVSNKKHMIGAAALSFIAGFGTSFLIFLFSK
jgi:hypothetical protein